MSSHRARWTVWVAAALGAALFAAITAAVVDLRKARPSPRKSPELPRR